MASAAQRMKIQAKQMGRRQRDIRVLMVFGIAVGLLAIAMIVFGGGGSSTLNFRASTLTGESVQLSDYRGKVVMLNFWATWCPPCIDELPALQDFAADQGTGGAVVLAVNSVESADQIQTYLDANAISLPDVPVVLDPEAALYRALGIVRLPTTWVIDAEGVLRTVKFGAFDRATLDAYLLEVAGPDA